MKILIISQYYYPEQFQINEIAPELVKRGHEVTVVCGVPNYPKGIVCNGYKLKDERLKAEKEYFQQTGVRVIHVEQVPRGHNPLQLMMNYWSFVRASKIAVSRLPTDFDVVFGYQLSPITSMYAALEYKKLLGSPVLFYTLDIWPVSAEGLLKSKRNPLFILVNWMSKKIYRGADKILVTSRPFIDYLHQVNEIPFEKMGYLPQHAGEEMLNNDLTAEDDKVVDFMFAGNIGAGQRVDVIIKAVQQLGKRNDYKLHLVGDGSKRKELEQYVNANGLKNNVIFYGNQKREDMPKFYKIADVLLITLRGNNEVGDTVPGKLQMYMTIGKTIIGAINGGAYEVIHEAKCGNCVKADDYKGLAQLMQFYIEHPDNFKECGANARDYFMKHFTLDIYIDGLELELKKLIKQ